MPFPLSMAAPKMRVRVVDVQSTDVNVKRLADLGLVKDTKLVVSNCGKWGVLLQLDGSSRLAVDQRMAEDVWVEEAAA
jgi:Fe2+ transport system protein FeoA